MSRKAKEKMIKKKFVVLLIVCCLLLVSLLGTLLYCVIAELPENKLAYINSNEMKDGTTSPKMIHVVISRYEGDLNPKAITKSTYNFINSIIPKYLKKIDSEDDAIKYYNKNKSEINKEIGIKNETEFVDLYKEISKLEGKLKYESSKFKMDEVEKGDRETEANLYIQYSNNPEICVKIIISDRIYANKTSIKYTTIDY